MNAKKILEQLEQGVNLRLYISKDEMKYLREHCAKDSAKPLKVKTQTPKADEKVNTPEVNDSRTSRSRKKRSAE